MNIIVMDEKIINLDDLSDFIYTATPSEISNLYEQLRYYHDRKAILPTQANKLAGYLDRRAKELQQEKKSLDGSRIKVLEPKGNTAISNRAGAITIGLLISSIAVTAIMYLLLAVTHIIK